MNARDLVQRETGLDLAERVIERAVQLRMEERGETDPDAYLCQMSEQELKALIELVVVPESWMFRDADAFKAATAIVRRRLAKDPARLVRILSLPCAGGEEPYSVAMSLQDAGVAPASVRIDAFDLSEVAIERARAGRYTRNAFRGRHLEFRGRYFSDVDADGEYQISAAIREQVNFSQGNLLTIDLAANARRYDLIFCRNLLIYFDAPTTAIAIARLKDMLTDDGVLFAGYAEVPSFCSNGFTPLRTPGAFALTKESARPAKAPKAAAPAQPRARPAPRTRPPVASPAAPAAARTSPAARAAAPAAAVAATPEALLEQARKLADHGDLAGAAQACQAALKESPASAEAYFILGMVSECQAKIGVADDYWRRCVYLQPDHYEALCHLALLSEQAGDAPQAAAFKQRAARIYQRQQDAGARKGGQ